MRIVEVEPAPCQHLHSSNYDPAKVVKGEPIQVLGDGRLWCFDCKEFFMPRVPPQRYTLKEIGELAQRYTREFQCSVDDELGTFLELSRFIVWLAKREREGWG